MLNAVKNPLPGRSVYQRRLAPPEVCLQTGPFTHPNRFFTAFSMTDSPLACGGAE